MEGRLHHVHKFISAGHDQVGLHYNSRGHIVLLGNLRRSESCSGGWAQFGRDRIVFDDPLEIALRGGGLSYKQDGIHKGS